MSIEMEKARKLVDLENRARVAAKELSQVSNELQRIGMEVKISGFDWNRPGNSACLCPQGNVNVSIVDMTTRPSR